MIKKTRSEYKAENAGSQHEIAVRLNGQCVRVDHDDAGNVVLMITGPMLPYFDGERLTGDFMQYLAQAGINPDIVVDAMLDAVESEAGVAAVRSVML